MIVSAVDANVRQWNDRIKAGAWNDASGQRSKDDGAQRPGKSFLDSVFHGVGGVDGSAFDAIDAAAIRTEISRRSSMPGIRSALR